MHLHTEMISKLYGGALAMPAAPERVYNFYIIEWDEAAGRRAAA